MGLNILNWGTERWADVKEYLGMEFDHPGIEGDMNDFLYDGIEDDTGTVTQEALFPGNNRKRLEDFKGNRIYFYETSFSVGNVADTSVDPPVMKSGYEKGYQIVDGKVWVSQYWKDIYELKSQKRFLEEYKQPALKIAIKELVSGISTEARDKLRAELDEMIEDYDIRRKSKYYIPGYDDEQRALAAIEAKKQEIENLGPSEVADCLGPYDWENHEFPSVEIDDAKDMLEKYQDEYTRIYVAIIATNYHLERANEAKNQYHS